LHPPYGCFEPVLVDAALIDRTTALRQANIFEPHHYRHIVGPISYREQASPTASSNASSSSTARRPTRCWSSRC